VNVLLDTNVLAELRKGRRANAGVRAWFDDVEPDAIRLSVVTIGEIRRGIENIRRRDPAAARSIEAWLRGLLSDHAEGILRVDLEVAEEWGKLNVPDPMPVIDGLLAATARVHGLTLVTRNVKDVEKAGVDVINPFT